MAGEVQDTSKKAILNAIRLQDFIQEEETPQGLFEDAGLGWLIVNNIISLYSQSLRIYLAWMSANAIFLIFYSLLLKADTSDEK